MRFDRRGDDVPFEDQVSDTFDVLRDLQRQPEIDATRIGLWGFSQGAWIAPMVASRTDAIRFLVLVASVGVTPAAQMLYATAKHVRGAGFGEDAAQRAVEARRLVDEWRRGNAPIERAQRTVDSLASQPWFDLTYLPRDLAKAGPWPDMDFDPVPIFAQVKVPVLLFYGEDDEWQPIDESVAAWQLAAKRAGNDDVTVVRLAGTAHAPTLGGRRAIDAVSPEYERTLVTWLERVTRRAASSRVSP